PGDTRHLPSFPTRRSSDLTQNAANHVANVNDVAFLAVQQMNTALVNSNVANLDVALAGVQQLAFTESAIGDIFTDVTNLANNATDRKSTRLNSSHVKISYA